MRGRYQLKQGQQHQASSLWSCPTALYAGMAMTMGNECLGFFTVGTPYVRYFFPFIITDWNHAFWNVVFMSCKYLVFASCACSIDVERSRFSFQKKSNFVMGIWETSNALWKAVRRLCTECPMVQAQVMDVQHAESLQKNMPLKKISVLFLSSLHLSLFSYLLGFYFPLKFFLVSFVISISFMFCWVKNSTQPSDPCCSQVEYQKVIHLKYASFFSRIAWSICSSMQVLHSDVCAVQNAGGCVCGGASSFQKTMYSSKF